MKIVVLGGGHGVSQMLKALHNSHLITAIISGADNGGSTRKFVNAGMFPPGDLTRAILAIARQSALIQSLLNARFGKGDSARNTILWERWNACGGNIQTAVEHFCEIVDAPQDCVIPITMGPYTIAVHAEGDFIMRGERIIDSGRGAFRRIHDAWLEGVQNPNPVAVRAIEHADVVILSAGDVYSSVVPCLLVPGIRDAIMHSTAPVIYCTNLRTKWGETHGFSPKDFLETMLRYAGRINAMLVNCIPLDRAHESRLAGEPHPSFPVLTSPGWSSLQETAVYGAPLLWTNGEKILHDPAETKAALEHIISTQQIAREKRAA